MYVTNILSVAALTVAVSGCAGGPASKAKAELFGETSLGESSRAAPTTADRRELFAATSVGESGRAAPKPAHQPELLGETSSGASAGAVPATAGRQLVPVVEGPPPVVTTSTGYVIGPRDLLSVTVFKVKELSSEERVNQEGVIVLPLVGPVHVAGLTPDQAEALIAQVLAKDFMYNPQVDIFVKEYANMKITVSGAVKKPGVFPITGDMTLVQAVAQAEGMTELASTGDVVIFRGLPGQAVHAYVVDLKKIQRGELPDPVLVSNDKVMVPESRTAVFLRDVTGVLRGFIYARPL